MPKKFAPLVRFPNSASQTKTIHLRHCWKLYLKMALYPINIWFHAKNQYLMLNIGQEKHKFGQETVGILLLKNVQTPCLTPQTAIFSFSIFTIIFSY